jgi:hypothetical protein
MALLFSNLIILTLVLTAHPTSSAWNIQGSKTAIHKRQGQRRPGVRKDEGDDRTTIDVKQGTGINPTITVPDELKLILALKDFPGRSTKGSFWEISYKWYMNDKKKYDKALMRGEKPNGLLLREGSFQSLDYSKRRNRKVWIAVPVPLGSELLKQILRNGEEIQTEWVTISLRVHDAKLNADLTKELDPAWRLSVYPKGITVVTINVTPQGRVNWSTDTPGARRQSKHRVKE